MIRSLPAVAAAVVLSACGAGSSGPSPVPPTTRSLECQSEPHRALAGTYLGTITYDAVASGGAFCEWSVALRIDAEAAPEGSCRLSGVASATVEQSVVPEAVAPFARECKGIAQSELLMLDPFANLPPTIEYAGLAAVAERGPYFGDTTVDADYVHLFDGVNPLVDAFVIESGTGALVPLNRQDAAGLTVSGRLVRQ